MTTEDLLASVKSRTLAPTGQITWTNTELTTILNEEFLLNLVPDLHKLREDYFLSRKQTTLTSGQDRYRLPERALGNTLKDLCFVDSANNRNFLSRAQSRDEFDTVVTGRLSLRYLIEGDEIVLLGDNNASGSLEFTYPRRPSKLVATTRVAKITNVSSAGGTTTLTVDTDLSSIVSTSTPVDFYNHKSPLFIIQQDVTPTAVTSTTIAVTQTDITDNGSVMLEVGNYVALAQESNLPLIPQEFHPVLAQMGAVYILEALGDQEKFSIATIRLEKMRKQLFDLVQNRVDNSPKHIRHRAGFINRSSITR